MKSSETDAASWRKLLQSSELEPDERLRLQRYLEELKSNPPGVTKDPCAARFGTSIQFPGPPTATAPLGQLGDYDILEELGAGAFGTVFRGFCRRLRREVAIKVLNPDHATVHRDRKRFEQEARVVSSLQNDYIVRIYDVCTVSDFPLPYLVMELIDGQSLAEYLATRSKSDGGMVEPQRVARLARQVALALGAAHELGLVHRDIKPSNIVLESATGRAKVTDFGLARQMLAPSDMSAASRRIIGTLAYMSPEQVMAPDQVDARSDLYSLGVVLYELLTGERPFRGTSSALLMQVVHDEPQSLRRLNPAVPRDLETICLKCMEKEPSRRYATAAALAEELQRFLAGEPIHARPVALWERGLKWAKRQPSVAGLLAAVAIVTLLGFAGVTWQWGQAERRRADARIAQAAAERARDAERAIREQVEKNLYFQRVARAHLEWLNNNLARADQLLDECPPRHRRWEWRYLRRLFHPELQTWRGHALPVAGVAFSRDGKLVASSSGVWNSHEPGRVIVRDARTGKQLHAFVAGSGAFRGLAFSPDGKRLAAANAVEGITVWNLTAGQAEMRPADHGHYDVAFSPSGKLLAGASAFGIVRVWDADTGELRHALSGHRGNVFCVAFSPDGALLASTGNDGTGRIWDCQTGQLVHLLSETGGRCVVFSPDARFLASCGYFRTDRGVVRVWDIGDEWNEVYMQRVHTGPVTRLAISPDSRFLGLNSPRDGTVRVWDLATGRERRVLRAHANAMSVAFSPDGRTLVSSGDDGVVKLWDMTQQPQIIFRQDRAHVSGLAFAPKTRKLAVAGGFNTASPGRGAKTAQVWDVTDPSHFSLERSLAGHREWLTSVAYSADGKRLATTDRAGVIRVWEAARGKGLWTIEGHDGPVASLAFSPNGKYLASCGPGTSVRIWDAQIGRPVRSLEGHQGPVHQVAFSPDGIVVASASDDHTARLWDVATGRVLRILRGHDAAVLGIAFDWRGELLATCGGDGLVHLWQVQRQDTSASEPGAADEPVRTLRGHTAAVTAVAFSGDQLRLASISDDATVKVWDIVTGQDALTLIPSGSGRRSSILFSTDGNLLAAACGHCVTLWDAAEQRQYQAATNGHLVPTPSSGTY